MSGIRISQQGDHTLLSTKVNRVFGRKKTPLMQSRNDTAAKGLISLPDEILVLIFSYLPFLDRFRLKMAGKHKITALLSTLSRPSFKRYLSQLATFTSKTSKLATGTAKVFYIACEEGFDALILKLLYEGLGLQQDEGGSDELGLRSLFHAPGFQHDEDGFDDLCLMPGLQQDVKGAEKALIAAISFGHESTTRILLKHIPKSPYVSYGQRPPANGSMAQRFFSRARPLRWYRSKRNVLDTALAFAATYGHESIARLLLRQGIQVSSPRGISAIYYAACRGHEDVVMLLSKRLFRHRGRKLSGPLIGAAENGHEATVRVLLDLGAEIRQSPSSPGVIHLAAKGGHERVVQLLLSNGVEDTYVDSQIVDGQTPQYPGKVLPGPTYKKWSCLHFAVYRNNYSLVNFLLRTGVKPRGENHHQATALPLAAMCGHIEIVKLLIESGFNVSATLMKDRVRPPRGESALELAAKYGYTDIMKLLVDAGASVKHSHALCNAVSNGSMSAVSLLLHNGINTETKNRLNETPLDIAIHGHHTEIVRLLLKSGCRTDTISDRGLTPLENAIGENQPECISLLLEHGAKTESVARSSGSNALSWAIAMKKAHLIPQLLQSGANIEAKGYNGQRPLHSAAIAVDKTALDILLTSKADRHARDDLQRTALHYAAEIGSCDNLPDHQTATYHWTARRVIFHNIHSEL